MKVYVANGTRQEWRFQYRFGASPRVMMVILPPGKQVDLEAKTGEDVADLVEQLERYGARTSNTAKRNIHGLTGLLYNLERPITSDEILLGAEAVQEMAQDRAVTQATRAAVRSDARDGSGKRLARTVDIQVERTVAANGRVQGTERMMSVSIDPNAPSTNNLPL